jgi:hypothetical protein
MPARSMVGCRLYPGAPDRPVRAPGYASLAPQTNQEVGEFSVRKPRQLPKAKSSHLIFSGAGVRQSYAALHSDAVASNLPE